MSLLPTSVYAGPSQAEALWAVAGSVGPGGGVTQLVAGAGVTLDPSTGEGVVTISATGGGGGGVSSVTASGAGITATPTTGAVVVANTGVTSLVAGSGITVSSATGAVTLNATFPALTAKSYPILSQNPNNATPCTSDICGISLAAVSANQAQGFIDNSSWAFNQGDAFCFTINNVQNLSGNFLLGALSPTIQIIRLSGSTLQISVITPSTFTVVDPAVFVVTGQLVRFAGRPV